MAMNGKVTIVTNKGGGNTKEITIPKQMTVDPDKYTITVAGDVVKNPKTKQVNGGDFIIISPAQVKNGGKYG